MRRRLHQQTKTAGMVTISYSGSGDRPFHSLDVGQVAGLLSVDPIRSDPIRGLSTAEAESRLKSPATLTEFVLTPLNRQVTNLAPSPRCGVRGGRGWRSRARCSPTL